MNHRAVHPVVIVCLAVLLSIVAAPVTAAAQAANLIPNPSFEQQTDGRPTTWRTHVWGGKGAFEYATGGRTGQRCLMIRSDEGADIGWYTVVAVEQMAKYRLSAWIKTENVAADSARGALLNLHDMQPIQTNALKGTNDWTKVEVVFETDGVEQVQINCLFGGWGLATGKAWYDDLRLELLSKKEWKPDVTIDAGKVAEPISKYIYGQFIEHLGRCIYGGIWAEMVEDRKFYYAVGDENSPWAPVDGSTIKMIAEDSFVGEHTPEVALPGGGKPGGIAQGGLGLIDGKRYAGRIWLSGADDTGPVSVSLVWGDGPSQRQTVTVEGVSRKYTKSPLQFTAGGNTDDGRLEITAAGSGGLRVGTVSLMPADNVKGMRRDTLELLRQLDSPVYRWPGGNFVSGYDWKDGIGDRDRRPPRKNPAWRGVEHNDVGIDEFLVFCRELTTEPYIAVNSGQGGVESAVEELQYANGGADTPMGKLRARNGHAEPYRVKWWGIGNEMYGGWQLGHMPLEEYVQKHNVFAEAMRAADSSIKLVAVGDAGPWSQGMMTHCADHMDLISEHFYVQTRPGLAAHVQQAPDSVRRKAEAHRRYRREFDSLRGKDIRIALDEWNYWYGPHVYGELGTRYFLKDALGIAAGLHEYARNSDIFFMANYAQTVNVIGCIKTSKTEAAFATTGLVLKLYRHRFGVLPVAVDCQRPLDVVAAFTSDRKTLTVAVVNPTMKELDIPLKIRGVELTGSGRRWQIAGDDPMAYNEPGKKPKVTIEESAVDGISQRLPVAPCSVTLYALGVN